jgi:hypothetical protein
MSVSELCSPHLVPVIESLEMTGVHADIADAMPSRGQYHGAVGRADHGGHDRPLPEPGASAAAFVRFGFAALIAVAVAVLLFSEFSARFGSGGGATTSHDPVVFASGDVVWALPAVAIAAVVGAALVVVSGSQAGLVVLARFGVPWLGRDARARANGLTWSAIGMLAVDFTGEAFEAFPGGVSVAAVSLGVVLGMGTFRLHRHAIEHEAYRTFNLIAMLLAAGSLASMATTSTGAWWTRNFSTLGTSDDLAAACFNVAIIVSGAGMAGMSVALTKAVAESRYGARRGGVLAMRVLIVTIGVSLMGVGLVPIDGATDLHNAAAATAAAAFAVLCLGIQLWARRLPIPLVIASYLSITIEVVAMIAYDGIGVFNLTVFEIVAFTLVFAWLIALVAMTHPTVEATTDAADASGAARIADRARADHDLAPGRRDVPPQRHLSAASARRAMVGRGRGRLPTQADGGTWAPQRTAQRSRSNAMTRRVATS